MSPRSLFLAAPVALSLLIGCNGTDAAGDETVGTQEAAIVGGTNADIADHPWQVSLRNVVDGMHLCGGVILDERWILTAQHCVYDSPDIHGERALRSPSSFRIAAGASKLSDMATLGQIRNVEEILRYPGYVKGLGGGQGKDVALIRLATPLTLGPNVQPIAVATPADEAAGLTNPGVLANVSGWGALYSQGSSYYTLRAVSVPIVSNEIAQVLYQEETITADQLAAGDLWDGGEDACQGDSGGPLTVAKGPGRILAGVVSWGYGCAEAQYPGMYARVASFRSWMSSVMASSPVVLDDRTNLSGGAFTWQHFAITVPAGAPTLNVHMSGAIGSPELYVRHGSPPQLGAYDCHSGGHAYAGTFANRNNSCAFDNPTPGTWYVSVYASTTVYSGVSLKSTSYDAGGWDTGNRFYPMDINGDGKDDMIIRFPDGGMEVRLTSGTTFVYSHSFSSYFLD